MTDKTVTTTDYSKYVNPELAERLDRVGEMVRKYREDKQKNMNKTKTAPPSVEEYYVDKVWGALP